MFFDNEQSIGMPTPENVSVSLTFAPVTFRTEPVRGPSAGSEFWFKCVQRLTSRGVGTISAAVAL